MSVKRSRYTVALPPGATIKEQLEDRGMTQKEFSLRMDMSEKHISRLINGEVKLTPDVARRLEFVLGIPAQFWNNLESIYRDKLIRIEEENDMDNDIEIAKAVPYREMADLGWVEKDCKDIKEKVKSLRRYFEVAKLATLNNIRIPGVAYRSVAVNNKGDYIRAAWAHKVRMEARGIDVESINLKHLQEMLPVMRKLNTETPESFCPKLGHMMSECGVVVVFLPHLSGSFLHGASFYDGKRIVLGLTVRGRDADRFWFSLFHEIGHILLGHIGYPDGPSDTGEKDADAFAAEILIPRNEYIAYKEKQRISKESIESFAQAINVDAGIVVGRLQNDGLIGYHQYGTLKKQYAIQS